MDRRHFLQLLSSLPIMGKSLLCTAEQETPFKSPFRSIVAQMGDIPDAAHIRRVMAAGPPASIILAALAPEKLIGWPLHIPQNSQDYLNPQLAKLPYLGGLTGRGTAITLDKLLELNPDLIIDSGTISKTYIDLVQRTYQRTHIPYLLLNGDLQQHPQLLMDLGHILGVDERAKTLAKFAITLIERTLDIRKKAATQDQIKFYYARGVDGLETAQAGSINTEVLEFSGGYNIIRRNKDNIGGEIIRLSAERILLLNPSIIFTQNDTLKQHIQSHALWQGIQAVKNHQVYAVPNLPFGWIDSPPSINRLIGLAWCQKYFFPDYSPAQEIAPLIKEFYHLFYGVTLKDEYIAHLLT